MCLLYIVHILYFICIYIYIYVCYFLFGPISIEMRRTDARLRRTDAHNLKLYCNDDMDGFGGYWMESMPV